MKKELPELAARMKLYLPNPSTRAILCKPIKSNIAEAHGQIATLLEEEYSEELVAEIGLSGPEELAQCLRALE
jgi:hypothetical protein